jgi:hypothetical protein
MLRTELLVPITYTERQMIELKERAKTEKTIISKNEEAFEQALNKAIEAVKQQETHYQHAGMTHVSSLLK